MRDAPEVGTQSGGDGEERREARARAARAVLESLCCWLFASLVLPEQFLALWHSERG